MRCLRLLLATVSLVIASLIFLNLSPKLLPHIKWIADIQLLPALLALNVGVIAAILLATLLFGRVYCSIICPMGIAQDCVTGVSNCRKSKKKKPYQYAPARNKLRYGVLAVFVIALIAGIGALFTVIAPYSAFGRIVSNLLTPVAITINNLLADYAAKEESYAFIHRPEMILIYPSLLLSVVTALVIGVMAWTKGRLYCNSICPVGTVLGLVSRFALLRPTIVRSKCISCRKCSFKCRSACIDAKAHKIDTSRCVMCMDCTKVCGEGAIQWKWANPFASSKDEGTKSCTCAGKKIKKKTQAPAEPSNQQRREFFAFAGAALLANTATGKKVFTKEGDGGLADIAAKLPSARASKIVPPGAQSIKNFYSHCTGCQLCVSNCPNQVLRPSTSLNELFQPEMSFEKGFCRPECVSCSDVCPAGAIQAIDMAEKSNIKIGKATCNHKSCISMTEGVDCGLCSRRCPTGAISMILSVKDDPNSRLMPIVDETRCIGCGACEFYCPVRPQSAIMVEGLSHHSPLA